MLERPLSSAFSRAARSADSLASTASTVSATRALCHARAAGAADRAGAPRAPRLACLARARAAQREAASVGENVEDAGPRVTLRVASGGEVILALVEEATGLLPPAQLRPVPHRPFVDDDRVRYLAGEHLHLPGEALPLARRRGPPPQEPRRG